MEKVVIKLVLHIVLITHVLLLMDHVNVLTDITETVVNTSVWFPVKTASMMPSVQCVQLANTGQPVPLTVNVTAVHVISRPDSVANNLHARHNAPRVLTLEIARRVRRGFTVLFVSRHVHFRVQIVVVIGTVHATSVIIQILMDFIVIYNAVCCVSITRATGGRVGVL